MSLTPLQYIGVDPDALHLWFTPGQYFNWSHFTDPALTKLIIEGQQETDPAKRPALYAQAQKIIMEHAVEMPIRQNIDLVMTEEPHRPDLVGRRLRIFRRGLGDEMSSPLSSAPTA